MTLSEFLKSGLVAAAALAVLSSVAEARPTCPGHPSCKDVEEEPPTDGNWMHEDVESAHSLGFTGVGSKLIIVDNHFGDPFSGNLVGGTDQNLSHGGWTSLQASLVAPGAGDPKDVDWDTSAKIGTHFSTTELNIVNLSFGLFDRAGLAADTPLGNDMWDSLVDEAILGNAVFVKAAGNTNGGSVDGSVRMRLYSPRPEWAVDYLNLQLIGTPGAIFVGALDGNGTVDNPASIASYSTIAGSNSAVQDMFLVVGVDSAAMGGLAGTSFAAPIVSGYAAILGHKFAGADASMVVDQLLNTARIDTIQSYSLSVHGQGEADLSRALSPVAIPE